MSKTEFSQAIRSEYKQNVREIKIKGDLKLATKKQGSNLMPKFSYSKTITRDDPYSPSRLDFNMENWAGLMTGWVNNQYYGGSFELENMPTIHLTAGTYTLIFRVRHIGSDTSYQTRVESFQLVDSNNNTAFSVISEDWYDGEWYYYYDTRTLENDIDITKAYFGYRRGGTDTAQYNEEFTMMLCEGDELLPFEQGSGGGMITIYDTFEIGEGGQCEILDFNVDEKSDIYYESMPNAELNIDVDNTEGYFSDFTENSITDKLNKDCYIDFYLNINDTEWCRAWTMQFDSLTADNQRARLTFKPYCTSIINAEQIYDKDKQFLANTGVWRMDAFSSFMQNNYSIDLSQDESDGGAIILNYPNTRNVKDLLLKFGAGVSNNENGQMLSILDNKKMRYKLNTRLGTTQEEITDNELLEKPLITKEELEGIVFTTRKVKSYSSTLTNWQKTISSVLKNTNDVLVVYGEEYNMVGVSANDITITGATLVSVDYIPYGGVAENGSHYLVIEITGNVGDRYTLEINSNLAREEEVETQQQIYAKGSYKTTDNFLKINSYEFANSQYWIKLLDHLTKKIELEIKALPYLQVGDSITLDDVGNVVIAEIHTSWSDGFKMKVIAYKVEYALYN